MPGGMTDEIACRVLDWNQDDDTTFAPAFGSEIFWHWTQFDKEKFPSCPIKGNIRVVLLTWNDKCEDDEYVITFRCGMTRVVIQEILQAATAKHNDFYKAKSKTMKTQRLEALAETKTPAYSLTHGYREIRPANSNVPSSILAMVEKKVSTSTAQAAHSNDTPTSMAMLDKSVTVSSPPAAHSNVHNSSLAMHEAGTATVGMNSIGGETVFDSVPNTPIDSTTVVGHEGHTSVAIQSDGPTSTGGIQVLLAAGTVVDSGQIITHNPTTPPVRLEVEDEQSQALEEADKEAQGVNHERSVGDASPCDGGVNDECQRGVNAEAHTTEKQQQLQIPPPPSTNDVHTTLPVSLTVAELKQLWKDATAKDKEEKKRIREATDVTRLHLREARAELKEAMQACRKKTKLDPKGVEHNSKESNEDSESNTGDEEEGLAKISSITFRVFV